MDQEEKQACADFAQIFLCQKILLYLRGIACFIMKDVVVHESGAQYSYSLQM